MAKLVVALILILLYFCYSVLVYTKGTEQEVVMTFAEAKAVAGGKALYQNYNCQSCHQLYGLGGYLGPDLTTAYSDKHRGEMFLRALLQNGGSRMPDFHFSKTEIDQLIAYLKYVDSSATSIKPKQ